MGSVADCFDNALAESVFATLECELFDQQPGGRFATRREAKLAVFDYLETFYNPRRRHSALGQIAPATFEARHTEVFSTVWLPSTCSSGMSAGQRRDARVGA
jgi:putative transposase